MSKRLFSGEQESKIQTKTMQRWFFFSHKVLKIPHFYFHALKFAAQVFKHSKSLNGMHSKSW